MALRNIIIILLLFFAKTISGQFLYYSVNLSFPISLNMVKIDKDLIFSKKSNAVYINDEKNQYSATPLGSLGFGVGSDLRKISIQLDANLFYHEISYKVSYPLAAGIDKEYIGKMSSFYLDIPLVVGTTFLNSSKIRPYMELGATYSYDITGSSEFWSDLSSIHETDLYQGLLYSGSRNNINGLAGVGIKSGLLFLVLKYNQRLTGMYRGCISSYLSINIKVIISKKNKSKIKYIHFED
jgi:hypothetical protein